MSISEFLFCQAMLLISVTCIVWLIKQVGLLVVEINKIVHSEVKNITDNTD